MALVNTERVWNSDEAAAKRKSSGLLRRPLTVNFAPKREPRRAILSWLLRMTRRPSMRESISGVPDRTASCFGAIEARG